MMQGMDVYSTLTTVDNDAKVIAVAKKYLSKDKRVTIICSSGEAVIDDMEASSVDMLFADTWPGKYHYVDEALALLRVGGIYVIDDMLPQNNWPEGHEKKVDGLIAYLYARHDLVVSYLSWATGVYICTKIKVLEEETNT
jgi:predicted O-methyltransferase YrrM